MKIATALVGSAVPCAPNGGQRSDRPTTEDLPNIALGSRGATAESEAVINHVCLVHRITVERLTGRDRHADIATIRFLTYYLLRHCCLMTVESIGVLMKRDHGAVSHGVKTLDRRMKSNPALRQSVDRWMNQFSRK